MGLNMSKKGINKLIEKRRLKKELKEKKLSDIYKIDSMSDEEFFHNKKKLLFLSIRRIILGVLIIIGSIIALICLWKTIFWTPNRWF